MAEQDFEERFHEAVTALDEVTGEVKPPQAWDTFGQMPLEEFWQSWPQIRAWGEWLWRLVDAERGEKAAPASDDSPYEEIGGSG